MMNSILHRSTFKEVLVIGAVTGSAIVLATALLFRTKYGRRLRNTIAQLGRSREEPQGTEPAGATRLHPTMPEGEYEAMFAGWC
jgi:hypothetical protein